VCHRYAVRAALFHSCSCWG